MPWTPPPNWPAPPSPDWTPPPGWVPDPSWGPAPAGWVFYPTTWSAQQTSPPPSAGAQAWVGSHKVLSIVIGLVVLFILIGAIGAAAGGGGKKNSVDPVATASPSASNTPTASVPPTPKPKPKPKPTYDIDSLKIEAKDLCEKDVKQLLKAPDTAKFDTAVVTNLGPKRYFLNGLVSAENGFGALIQGGYHCSAKFLHTKNGEDDFLITPKLLHQ